MRRVGAAAAHLRRDRRELGDGELRQRRLEGRKLRAAKILQHRRALVTSGERRVDADEVFRLGPPARAPSPRDGSGSGSVFALRIFCAIVSASSVRLMRE